MSWFALVAVLLAAPGGGKKTPPAPAPAPVELSRFEQGQKLFNEANFEGALKMLDAAVADTTDPDELERIHLLRAQAFAAKQEFVRAEEAFALALDANPEASLDPSKVDPTVVKLLEAVRGRMQGTLSVNSTPPGAHLRLGGKPAGDAPNRLSVPAGRHTIGAQWDNGPLSVLEVQVRPRREVHVEFVQPPPVVIPEGPKPEERPLTPFGELRGAGEVSTSGTVRGGLDLGGGIEFSYFRVGLWVRMFPYFMLTPRFQFSLPVYRFGDAQLNVLLEAGVPVPLFPDLGVGIHGQGGVELYPVKWFGVVALVGARHMFAWEGNNDVTAVTGSLAVRLRVP